MTRIKLPSTPARRLRRPPGDPSATLPCCPPRPSGSPTAAGCRQPTADRDRPGYRIWPFVVGWEETPLGAIPLVATRLTWRDRLGHWRMRWGLGREHYRIAPGIYAVGAPNDQSPALISANYKMSFDHLRRALDGLAAWILVIDTKGINVWCAAGKGTFGTEEIVRQVRDRELNRLVTHRTLIAPQLGAPGVAAHLVQRECGFRVVYGPVRAKDLGAFLAAGLKATEAMRRVTFSIGERLVLTPVELTGMLKPTLWAALALFALSGFGPGIFSFGAAWHRGGSAITALLCGILLGAVAVPLLLPWLPGRAFSLKGAILGLLAGLPLVATIGGNEALLGQFALLLMLSAASSYRAMNFTGATTFTSPSGVEKEMRRAIPLQLAALLLAGICWIGAAFR